MKVPLTICFLVVAAFAVQGQIAPILLEACNGIDSAAKRLECLRAANDAQSTGAGQTQPSTSTIANQLTAPGFQIAPNTTGGSSRPKCFVGPRGGTYTITASGRKNYSGC